jgi:hypothetical protein
MEGEQHYEQRLNYSAKNAKVSYYDICQDRKTIFLKLPCPTF